MDNRFTLKDFIFLCLFVFVILAICWTSYQFNYQEGKLNDLQSQLQKLNDGQKEQIATLGQIRDALRHGAQVNSNGNADTMPANASTSVDARIRRTNPDGSLYVYYPTPPKSPHDPLAAPDYATGDWLVQNLNDEPKVISPYIPRSYSSQLVQAPVLESMLATNPDTFEPEPVLAESYYVSTDGLTLRFVLRKSICFSDGVPITAADVLFSFNTIMNPGVDCAPYRGYFDNVKACNKIDDRTIEFKMSKPYFLAAQYLGGISIIPEHVYKFSKPADFNNQGEVLVGSGPYKVDHWDRGQQLVLARNDKYWSDRPTFDKLVFKFIINPQAAFQSFQNEQIDSDDPDAEQYAKFSEDAEFTKKFTLYKFPRPDMGYTYVGYNLVKPMFKDKLTRQALAMLIDRDAIIHTFLKDLAMPISGPFSPMTPQHDQSIAPLPHDPEGAKRKLAEAGWKVGSDGLLERAGVKFEFELSMPADAPIPTRIANYMKEQFERAGIRMRITPWEFATLVDRIDERKFDAILLSWSGDVEGDPYQIWHSDSIKDKGSNAISFINKESDHLIEVARTTLDTGKRMELWHQWERLIADEQPCTFLFSRLDRIFINGRFKNTQPYKLGVVPYDWYVPAKSQKYH